MGCTGSIIVILAEKEISQPCSHLTLLTAAFTFTLIILENPSLLHDQLWVKNMVNSLGEGHHGDTTM